MTRITRHVDTLITRLPAVLSAAVSPSMWALDRLHIDLYDNQIEVVDAICNLSPTHSKIAILQARGSGKSFATGVALIKLCLDIPGISIGIFGPKAEQATRIIKEIRTKILIPSCPVYNMVDEDNSVNSRLVFRNGSYLQAISASVSTQNEGWHFHIAVIDEAHRVADIAVNQRIIPMLGSLPIAKIIKIGIAMYRNNFWKSCSGTGTPYRVFKRSWENCDILLGQGSVLYKGKEYPKYVMDQMPLSLRRKSFPDRPDLHWDGPAMTEFDFKTNYSMEWLQDVDLELTEEEQTKLVTGTHDILAKARPDQKEQYFFGLDTASGSILPGRQNLDNTVLSVWRRVGEDVKEKVACFQWQGSVLDQIREIKQIINPSNGIFPCLYGLADYSNIGISIVESFKAEGIPIEGIMYNVTEPTSRKNHKNAMFDHFKFELQGAKVRYPSLEKIGKSTTFTQAFTEWCILERHKSLGINDKIEAPSGAHDDHCNADVLAVWCMDRIVPTSGKRMTIINMPSPISGPASLSGRGINTHDVRQSGYLDRRPLGG